jgi:hypothetical protein
MDPVIVLSLRLLLIVGACVLAVYDLFRLQGRARLAWAVLALAIAMVLR